LAASTSLISGFNALSLEGWAVVKVAMLLSTKSLELKGFSAITHPLKLEMKYGVPYLILKLVAQSLSPRH
jgi:hypothetical protein